MFNMYLVT